MPNTNSKGLLIFLLVVLVLAAAAVVAINKSYNNRSASSQPIIKSNNNQQPFGKPITTPPNVMYNLPSTQIPTAIPGDLPIEKTAVVTENYQTQDPTQQHQESERAYTTTNTLAKAFADYKSYFNKNGWTIGATLDTASLKSIMAKKDLITLQVVFDTNSVTKTNTVTITADYLQTVFAPGTTITVPITSNQSVNTPVGNSTTIHISNAK